MNRGPASVLTAEDTGALDPTARAAAPGPAPSAPGADRQGLFRRLLTGFRDSCVLVAVALLGCLALVAVGTVGSLAWMFLGNL
jgi:hypothetical protein